VLFESRRIQVESIAFGGNPTFEEVILSPSDANFGAALLDFNGEAGSYCRGISDAVAHKYAMDYTRMIEDRAKGMEVSLPRIPTGLFEPNRNLIRSTLERMCEKHFLSK